MALIRPRKIDVSKTMQLFIYFRVLIYLLVLPRYSGVLKRAWNRWKRFLKSFSFAYIAYRVKATVM